ncbi:LPXTG cell wall anchor domain-containing protein, partial [Enterococcus mundtii]|uniref:LPXTG cell wall anchor domain-containing protein n=1 Tax=Enterococcus mundtii TaxID=53346 RepID=UPI003B213F9B
NKRGKLFFLILTVLLVMTVWGLSKTIVAEATTGEITVTGKIGETVNKEREGTDEDKKQTIVADVSQIGQGKLPQTGSSNTNSLRLLGYAILLILLVLLLLVLVRKSRLTLNKIFYEHRLAYLTIKRGR